MQIRHSKSGMGSSSGDSAGADKDRAVGGELAGVSQEDEIGGGDRLYFMDSGSEIPLMVLL